MTQKELIIKYCEEHSSIVPAMCANKAYRDNWFGSELARVCRKMRTAGILTSQQDGKYEKFYLIKFSDVVKSMESELNEKVANWNKQFYPTEETKQAQLF